MAVLAFSALGAGIGASIGGTFLGMSAASIGWTIGGLVGSFLFPQSQPDQHREGPRIADTRFTSSAYGQMVPIVYGTYPVAGNTIWASAVREVANTSSEEVGGKAGGGSTVSSTTYSYFVDLAILLCEGEIAGVRKIKVNGETKYNVSVDAPAETIAGSALLASSIRVYTGSESQTADPLIAAAEGTLAPAYRGYAYVVIESMDVTPYGGRPPQQLEFEVVTVGTAADLEVVIAQTLGATDGSTLVLLAKDGNVYAGPESVGSETNRWNFYSGTKLGSYVPASFSYSPIGKTFSGEVIAGGSGSSTLTVLHENGTVSPYTGAITSIGGGALSTQYASGIYFDSDTTFWARGDSTDTARFHRGTLGATSYGTTHLAGLYTWELARNAVGIAGRIYMLAGASISAQAFVGYVDASTLSFVPLVALTDVGGILVSSDGYLWVGPANSVAERKTVRKYDRDGTLLLTIDVQNTEASGGYACYEDQNGFIWAIGITASSSRRAYQIQPTTGQILQRSEEFIGAMLGFTEDNRSVIWATVSGNYVLREIEPLPRLTVGTTSLSAVVSDICTRTGLVSGDLSLTALTDTVRGYSIGRRMTARAAIEPLLPAYRFDLIESDDLLKAVKRSGTVVATIDEDDLGAHVYGADAPSDLISRRLLETDLPLEVIVQYPDADAEYEPGAQYARRLVGASRDPHIIQMPMVLTNTEAQQLAELVLYERWIRRMTHQLELPRKYARIEPSDVIAVGGHTLLVTQTREADGVLSIECVADQPSVYEPEGVGAPMPTPDDSVGVGGPTVLRLLDIPLLRDADDSPGFYAVAGGYYTGWPGAELWRSIDGGVSYQRTDVSFLHPSPIGSAVGVLGNFLGGNVFDRINSVDVYVSGDVELSSSTEALVLAGANAFYMGGELGNYLNATLVSPGRYTLSGLLRGRKGTEQYMATHAIGELFVALNTDTTRRVNVESSEIGVERHYKAVTFGQTVAAAPAVPFTLAAVGLKPLSSVLAGVGRTAAASYDIIITWVPRSRLNAEWRDFVDVPVGEATEAYEVVIYTTSGYTTVKRTVTGLTTPTMTYTSAQQVTDFGSNQATIYFDIFKISAIVGRGFVLRGSG